MQHNTIVTIVIIITTMAALLLFLSSDNSGLTVQDCLLEQDSDQQNKYDLNYSLLIGRQFNHIECQYTIYSQDNQTIYENKTIFENISTGIYPIHENLTFDENNTLKPSKIDMVVYHRIAYEEDGVNKTKMEKAYNKTFKL